MEVDYPTVLRYALVIGGPVTFVASLLFAFMVWTSVTINKLIAILATPAWLPVSASIAYGLGTLLVPSMPVLGFVCALGYGSIVNWGSCYVVQFAGEHAHSYWKSQLLLRSKRPDRGQRRDIFPQRDSRPPAPKPNTPRVIRPSKWFGDRHDGD